MLTLHAVTSWIRMLVQCIVTNRFRKELWCILLLFSVLGENQIKRIFYSWRHLTPLHPCKEWWHVGALWVRVWKIFHCLNFRLFLRARASLYQLTSFLSAWLLDVYLTRAVSCASLRSHIRETRVIREGTLLRDCNRRNCARSLNMTGARSQSARVRSHINNEQMLITDICTHNEPWSACVWGGFLALSCSE